MEGLKVASLGLRVPSSGLMALEGYGRSFGSRALSTSGVVRGLRAWDFGFKAFIQGLNYLGLRVLTFVFRGSRPLVYLLLGSK